MSRREGEVRFELMSTLESVERACLNFRSWRMEKCSLVDGFSTELIFREALTNSVVHGFPEDAGKRIYCVLRPRSNRLVIAIRDEGDGFDWRAGWDRKAELSDDHGRGIEIFRRYASAVRFNRKGNSVTLIKRFQGTI